MAAVTICTDFGAPKLKSLTVSIVSPSICHEVMGTDAMILVFQMLSFKPSFSLSSFTFIKRLFSSSLSARRVVSSAYLRLLIFSQKSWFQLVFHRAQHFTWCTLHISWISRVSIYSRDALLSRFGTSLLFHVWFYLLLLDLLTGFSGGRSGGLVVPSLRIFHSLLWSTQSNALV